MLMFRRVGLIALVMVAASCFASGHAQAQLLDLGNVYTASNDPDGNRIQTYLRLPQGSLLPFGSTATGGAGTGSGLGSQGGIVLTENGRWLLAVNAGDNTVSVFLVGLLGELYLTDVADSGGELPISVTAYGNTVYVLNAAGAGSIQGFRFGFFGNLQPLAGSAQPLSGAETTAPAQIQFSPNGRALVVTEKATNLIDVFPVDAAGRAQSAIPQASEGMTPFGFDFDPQGRLIVSEAFGGTPGISAVSSYQLQNGGALATISASVPDLQTAACWIEITNGGRFAYTTNTGSGSISGYAIDTTTGSLTLLDANGVTADTGEGSGPLDLAATGNSRFLYVFNNGTSEIQGYRVNAQTGALTRVTTASGLPDGANGLGAR